MKRIGNIIFLFIVSAHLATAALPGGWSTNFPAAQAEAQAKGQPLLVYFTASWCGPCRMMAQTTFTNETVAAALGKIPHVAVDIDANSDLATSRGVRAVPTFQLLVSGDEAASTVGYQEAQQFVGWLTNGIADANRTAVQQQQAREKIRQADTLLAGRDTESTRRAVSELIAVCDGRQTAITQSAIDRLRSVATNNPTLLLDGVNDARLPTRICLVNLLREILGETFDVDPWSDAATRQKAVALWREKLQR